MRGIPEQHGGGHGSGLRILPWVLAALLLQACATPGTLQQARSEYRAGALDTALSSLDPQELPRRDRLLGWLDRGLIAHAAGQYTASRDAFFAAAELVDELDRISVSEQTSAVLINDWAQSYSGEYSERLWIHTFQMMNFLLLGEPEGAAVEARQALEVLDEHRESLSGDWFTRALMAESFTAAGQFDSAAIEYRSLLEDYPAADSLAGVATTVARRAGRVNDIEYYASLGNTGESIPVAARTGRLVFFVRTGRVATKRSGDLFVLPDIRISFPYYEQSTDWPLHVEAYIDDDPALAPSVTTYLSDVARVSLEARGKALAARQALRAGTKHALGDAADEQSLVLGAFVRSLLFLLEQADTRGWETLPGQLALVMLELPPGQHDVRLSIDSSYGTDEFVFGNLEISAGRTQYRQISVY